MITTQKELRASFWEAHPQFKRAVKRIGVKDGRAVYVQKTQNDYVTDIRCAWVDYVDAMERNGEISEALADRATLYEA